MKKIGYIHRYSQAEEKGILVYGYNSGPLWNSPAPILFTKFQCKTSVKTGILVYFEISRDEEICNIEYASIFNFDRDLLFSYVSMYDTMNWEECEKHTHICYQNIFELKEWISFEMATSNDTIEGKDAKLDNEEDLDDLVSFDNDFFDFDDDKISIGEYCKIVIPESIDEEFVLFGKQFPKTNSIWDEFEGREENQTIKIDILNPSLWIPLIPISCENYYGKNENEFKDLFEILVVKKRAAYDRYLSDVRSSRTSSWPFWMKLSESEQRMLNPDWFPNDSISRNWKNLLNNLSDTEVKNVYSLYPLLQPVLSDSFCEENLDILSEHYGFPSISIAEQYLIKSIYKIISASEYCHFKDLLYTFRHCRVKHLPDEGIPLCLIGKKRLDALSCFLNSKLESVLSFVKFQIADSVSNHELLDCVDEQDTELMLNIGKCYDSIKKFVSNDLDTSTFEVRKITEAYDGLPKSVHILFDSYLSRELKSKIVYLLMESRISPAQLHFTLTTFSKWIDESFLKEFSEAVDKKYSEVTEISDLKDAYEYNYISEKAFIKRYLELSFMRTDEQCLEDLCGCDRYCLPEKTQLYILRRVLKKIKLGLTYSYKNKKYNFPGSVKVGSLYDFLRWLNDNTVTEDTFGSIGTIERNVSEQIQKEIASNLSEEDSWRLFEQDLIANPGEANIKRHLAIGYSLYKLEKSYFDEDCFQVQMSLDLLKETDKQLIKIIIDKLNLKFKKNIEKKIQGFAKLYLWSLNPNNEVDWNCIKQYFIDLPKTSQKRVFRYLFLMQSNQTLYSVQDFLQLLIEVLLYGRLQAEKSFQKNDHDSSGNVYPEENVLAALSVLVQILKIKFESYNTSIEYSHIESIVNLFHGSKETMLRVLQDFFEECRGWMLLSYETQNLCYFARNGYIIKIGNSKTDEVKYKVCFYEVPLDLNGYKNEYLDSSGIARAIAILKKNFNYQYDNDGYLISTKDEIRLKEYVIYCNIDDKCNLFDEFYGYGEGQQSNGVPAHIHAPIRYKENNSFICNCGTYKNMDPSMRIPYRWCKQLPCTKRFFFLQPEAYWEKFKFADLLWIILKDKVDLEQLWEINSEISSFINSIAISEKETIATIKSQPLQHDEEVGEWTSSMHIFTVESYDDYGDEDYEYEDCDELYNERDTYERYNGSWAQDVGGYSDDDIDTIFDGDPSAYWNID